MTKEKVTKRKAPKKEEAKFSKEQLVKSRHFKLSEQSFLEVVLKNDVKYTLKEAQKALAAQFKRKVDK